jgi:type VI secretion system protein ImpA
MPFPAELESIDPEEFLAPLSADNPCGVDLQASEEGRSIRSRLRDLRNEARRIERQADESNGSWSTAIPVWKKVREECFEVLKKTSRDLDIVALAIEALARTNGFHGLLLGFSMAQAFVETFWSHLYPAPDPEDGPSTPERDAEARVLPLDRLVGVDADGLLSAAIYHIPLLQSRGGLKYALCDWRSSRLLSKETDRKKIDEAVAGGAVLPASFSTAVRDTPIEFIADVRDQITQANDAWKALSESITNATDGKTMLLVGPLDDLFTACLYAIAEFAPASVNLQPKPAIAASNDPGLEPTADEPATAASANGAQPSGAMPLNREDAFQRLEMVADYFDRHDPHSLLSAQIRNVVRLGRLPREEFFAALIEDKNALKTLFKSVGITPPT